jgi:NAD(P)-dependent dehydrogenase (short-subunit alcohol dehydrogenase family)
MSTTWFVTGASSGIGAAIVDASLARSDTVVATFRDAEGAQRFAASSAHAIGVLADVRSTEQVDAAVAHAVDVCDEVPYLVDHDGPSPRATAALREPYATVEAVTPTVKDSMFHMSAVDQLAEVSAARRERISSSSSGLPEELLIVVIATILVLVAVTSVLDTQHRRWHVALMAAVTLLVALNLALVLTLARPYDGAAEVSTAPLTDGVPAAALRCGR